MTAIACEPCQSLCAKHTSNSHEPDAANDPCNNYCPRLGVLLASGCAKLWLPRCSSRNSEGSAYLGWALWKIARHFAETFHIYCRVGSLLIERAGLLTYTL